MKLTLWQQFSSNHSNGFTLVGVFENETEAEQALKRIHELLETIDRWYEENYVDKYDNWDTTDPEYEIAEAYGFEWPLESPTDFWSGAVQQFKNIVTIDSSADSWTRRKPYESLLQKLGGEVAGWDSAPEDWDSPPTMFVVEITGTAPTEADAETLFQRWQEQLTAKKSTLKKEGLRITISELVFNRDLFVSIVKSFEEAGCTDIHYQLEKKPLNS